MNDKDWRFSRGLLLPGSIIENMIDRAHILNVSGVFWGELRARSHYSITLRHRYQQNVVDA
jgi:hypothetical protein